MRNARFVRFSCDHGLLSMVDEALEDVTKKSARNRAAPATGIRDDADK